MPGSNQHKPIHLPRSLPLLLARRVEGQFQLPNYGGGALGNPRTFIVGVARQLSPRSLVRNPQLLTPQTQSISGRRSSSAINSIHVDRTENRFVLAGGVDAIVNVYDLSKWGSEEYLQSRQNAAAAHTSESLRGHSSTKKSIHRPIASSQRGAPRALFSSDATPMSHSVEVPSGHSSSISKVQWYPVDSGAFLSASKDGSLLVWDTDSMTPVTHCNPFDTKGIHSLHLSPLRNYSVVVASLYDPSLKLVDIRSGASSHTLLGHAHPGVSAVQWAPHNDVILASGGGDGTVRLWDIRKAGGRACVAILNQDKTRQPKRAKPYRADYSHLPKPPIGRIASFSTDNVDQRGVRRHVGTKKVNSKSNRAFPTIDLAPNNYRGTENTNVASHGGPVSALSFGAVGDGHHLVSASQDGNLHIWDLRGNGHLRPIRFLAQGQQSAISRQRKQTPLLLTTYGIGPNEGSNLSEEHSSLLGGCWVGNGSSLLGYSLERGGIPQKLLQGHMNFVTSIDAIEATMQVLSAGKDGMILTWGKPERQGQRKRRVDEDSW